MKSYKKFYYLGNSFANDYNLVGNNYCLYTYNRENYVNLIEMNSKMNVLFSAINSKFLYHRDTE